jgi:hypothetical protein
MLEVETVQEYWSTLDISSNNLIQLNSLKVKTRMKRKDDLRLIGAC